MSIENPVEDFDRIPDVCIRLTGCLEKIWIVGNVNFIVK
jgi:hypothetical protein